MSPFEGKPWSVYVPARIRLVGDGHDRSRARRLHRAGLGGGSPPRVIAPDDLGQEMRGKGTNIRHVTNILPETEPAEFLLVVEVITPAGNTSSYPPHKHDRDDLPRESCSRKPIIIGSTRRRASPSSASIPTTASLDEAMAVEDGDVTLVPKGYHPCATSHGYDLYYLNVMAGPKRTWKFHNARRA